MVMMMMSIVETSSIGRITRVHKSIYAREKRGDVWVNRAVVIRRSSLLIFIDSIGEDRRCRLLISAAWRRMSRWLRCWGYCNWWVRLRLRFIIVGFTIIEFVVRTVVAVTAAFATVVFTNLTCTSAAATAVASTAIFVRLYFYMLFVFIIILVVDILAVFLGRRWTAFAVVFIVNLLLIQVIDVFVSTDAVVYTQRCFSASCK